MQIVEKDISWVLERVPDFMKFYNEHQIMFEGGYLAGGFLRSMVIKGTADLAKNTKGEFALANDIDFFYTNAINCNNAIRDLAKLSHKGEGLPLPRYSSEVSLTGYAHDFYDHQTNIKYQLIVKNVGTPYQVLNRFDISNCKIATDGKKVWMVEDWEQLEKNKNIRIDNYAGNYIFKRFTKYLLRNKDYTVCVDNRDELLMKMVEKSKFTPSSVRSLLRTVMNCFPKEKITIFYGLLGNISASEKDGNYEEGSLNQEEDFALHMYKRRVEKEAAM